MHSTDATFPPMEASGGDRIDGAEFKRRREAIGLKVADLASFARVTKGTIASYESGERRPRDDQYRGMLDVLLDLEAGRVVTLTVQRQRTRSGGVIIARHLAEDISELDAALEEMKRDENGDDQGK